MTVHAHDPAVHTDSARPGSAGGAPATAAARPRWLVPGLLIGLIAATLVVAGVLPFSTVLYAGLIGGMLVMHLGGHGGHGGHGGNSGNSGPGGNGGHAGHGGPGDDGTDDQAPAAERTNEARDDNERPVRGCH